MNLNIGQLEQWIREHKVEDAVRIARTDSFLGWTPPDEATFGRTGR